MKYFKKWFPYDRMWEYYREEDFDCDCEYYYWNSLLKKWLGCGSPSSGGRVEVSPLEMLIILGSKAVEENI